MARSRNIKPGFFKNEELVDLPMATRLLFIGLWTIADREGRLEDKPKRIRMEIFPADNVDVEAALADLHNRNFIVRYGNVDGKFIEIAAFKKHQNPHYSEKASVIKPPDSESTPRAVPESPRVQEGVNRADSLVLIPDSPIPDSGLSDSPNPDSGKKRIRAARSLAPGFPEFWSFYPRKIAKATAEKSWAALAPDDDLRVTILAALETQKQSRQWSDSQFIPHPATWLNQRRWDDEVPRETDRDPVAAANQRAADAFVMQGGRVVGSA